MTTYLPHPITVAVSERGAVTVEVATRTVAMSPFSERAKSLTLEFGPGTHMIRTEQDVEDLPAGVLAMIDAALA
jgi:hypothetical protein